MRSDGGASHDRVLDAWLEDGQRRSPLAGLFPPTLLLRSLQSALEPLAARYPQLREDGRSMKIARRKARQLARTHGEMSEDERASIVLYTMEDHPREDSLYYVLNAALREHRASTELWRDYIWLLMHALRKLPASDKRVAFRGCECALRFEPTPGTDFQWSAFSSTATTIGVMKDFLGATGPRTLFILQLAEPLVARDVRAFSIAPSENEILLPPNVRFEVVDSFDTGGGLVQVQCKQVETLDTLLDLSAPGGPTISGAAKPELRCGPRRSSPEPVCTGVVLATIEAYIAALRCGVAEQQENAAGALSHLARSGADRRNAIAAAGGISPLVDLVRRGTAKQKEHAAAALRNVAHNSPANQVDIATAGGIGPLVALARSGTAAQKEIAAGALRRLASNSVNKKTIERLQQMEDDKLKKALEVEAGAVDEPLLMAQAEFKSILKQLGIKSKALREEMSHDTTRTMSSSSSSAELRDDADIIANANAGGVAIDPQIELTRGGTAGQNEHATGAVRNLADNSNSPVGLGDVDRRQQEEHDVEIVPVASCDFCAVS